MPKEKQVVWRAAWSQLIRLRRVYARWRYRRRARNEDSNIYPFW
jgi:hypothetical protein